MPSRPQSDYASVYGLDDYSQLHAKVDSLQRQVQKEKIAPLSLPITPPLLPTNYQLPHYRPISDMVPRDIESQGEDSSPLELSPPFCSEDRQPRTSTLYYLKEAIKNSHADARSSSSSNEPEPREERQQEEQVEEFTSNFSREQFHWVEEELKEQISSFTLESPVEANFPQMGTTLSGLLMSPLGSQYTEDYGADVEDSPCRNICEKKRTRERKKYNRQDLTIKSLNRKGKQRESPLPPLTPLPIHSCDQNQAATASSSRDRKRSVTFREPREIHERDVLLDQWNGDAFASLNPFSSRPTSQFHPRRRPRALTSPPYSPHLGSENQKGNKKAARLTTSSRPPSLLLGKGSMMYHGCKSYFKQGGRSAPAVYDAVGKHLEWENQQDEIINTLPRRPSVIPTLLPRRVSKTERNSRTRLQSCSLGEDVGTIAQAAREQSPIVRTDEETKGNDDTSPPPPGGFPIDISVRLRGLDAPTTAELEPNQFKLEGASEIDRICKALYSRLFQEAEVQEERLAECPLFPVSPLAKVKKEAVQAWVLGTFEETVVHGNEKVFSPASNKSPDPIDSSPSSPRKNSSGSAWKLVPINHRPNILPSPLQTVAYGDFGYASEALVSTSTASLDSIKMDAIVGKKVRRFAHGNEGMMIAPLPRRPSSILDVQQCGVEAAPKPSPIKRAFNLPSWKHRKQSETMVKSPLSPCSPSASEWFASRSTGHLRATSDSALKKISFSDRHKLSSSPSPTLSSKQPRRIVSALFKSIPSPLGQPWSPVLNPIPCVDEATYQRNITQLGLGLSLPTTMSPLFNPHCDTQHSHLSLDASPALIDLSSPAIVQEPTSTKHTDSTYNTTTTLTDSPLL